MIKVKKNLAVPDAIDELKSKTTGFLMHSFVTYVQYLHFEERKQNATLSLIVLQVDFSENYRTAYQDEIQSAFYNYNQVG